MEEGRQPWGCDFIRLGIIGMIGLISLSILLAMFKIGLRRGTSKAFFDQAVSRRETNSVLGGGVIIAGHQFV